MSFSVIAPPPEMLARGKEYEYLVASHDPMFEDMMGAIEIVKEFIATHGLVLYGGTAIDGALRLCGDYIYPDDVPAVPDLDFYSPNAPLHAYQLADLLFKSGRSGARTINALHMKTMKVDIGENHFIADISQVPPGVFAQLPTLVWNGMKIIHPNFQCVDTHSALAFPYDNPPMEVIFARWEKDIVRFNKLRAHYPVCYDPPTIDLQPVTAVGLNQCVFTGFAACSLITGQGNAFAGSAAGVTFNGLDACEIVHHNPERAVTKLGLTGVKRYEPYIQLMPARLEGMLGPVRVIVYSTADRLVAVNSIPVGNTKLRVTNVQYLLRHFIAMGYVDAERRDLYWSHYAMLLARIRERPTDPLMRPSITTYGDANISLSRRVALNRIQHDIAGVELLRTPRNYYPGKGRPPPEFDPETIELFQESGREI